MTIASDIVTALDGVALDTYSNAKVFPQAAPEDVDLPLVIFKRLKYEPENTTQGYAGIARSTFVFECWGKTQDAADDLAEAVNAAITADSTLQAQAAVMVDAEGEDYEPATDEYVTPVYWSFWHA